MEDQGYGKIGSAKFKVGDRVRRVHDVHMGMRPGDEATVTGVTAYNHVELDGYEGQHYNDMLELATPSSIRTVTRREIVPGVYGPVCLYDDHSANVDCLRDASTAREAARIFNEIADVLEEGA